MMKSVEDYQSAKKIEFNHTEDTITFHMLTKPASEGGDMSRAQLVDLVKVATHQLKFLNAKFSCRENSITITKLEEALMWQEKRTADRIVRNVEGRDER